MTAASPTRTGLHRKYGAPEACAYLIRPDGYVTVGALPPGADGLGAFLARAYGWGSGGGF